MDRVSTPHHPDQRYLHVMRSLKVFLHRMCCWQALLSHFSLSPSTLGSPCIKQQGTAAGLQPLEGAHVRSCCPHILHQCYIIQPVQPAPAASLPALHSTKPAPCHRPVSHNTAVPVLFWTIKLILVLMVCFRRGLPQLRAKRDCGTCSWCRAFGTLRLVWGSGSAGKSDGFFPPCTEPLGAAHPVCLHTKITAEEAAVLLLPSPFHPSGQKEGEQEAKQVQLLLCPTEEAGTSAGHFDIFVWGLDFPFFKLTYNKLPVLNKGSWRLFSEGEDLVLAHSFYLHHLISFLQSSLHCFRTWYTPYPTVIPVPMSCFDCTSLQEVFGC